MTLHFGQAFGELAPSLFSALKIVTLLAVLAFALALIIGIVIAIGRIFGNKTINRILIVFVEIIRGTPLLVQLLYMYYVVPELLNFLIGFVVPDFHMNFGAFEAGVLGLGLNYGSYMSEVFRSSILAVDKGQNEAALALGYTRVKAMRHIIFPQSIRISLPSLGNYFVMLLKDTSLCAFITLGEIILTTQSYAAQTFLTIEAYTIAALVYLVASIPLGYLVRVLERRMAVYV